MNKHDSMQYQIRDPKGFANMLDRDVDRSFYNEKLIFCLKNTIASDGFVYAAFYDGKLKGFVSVESEIFGGKQGYCDLSSIHISEDMRRKGIGRTLFLAAKEWAKQKGAKKLYISAHSAVESQAFYKSMVCVEAEVYNQKHVEDEPYDCQLDCGL